MVQSRVITRNGIITALSDQGFQDAFDLKSLDALLDSNDPSYFDGGYEGIVPALANLDYKLSAYGQEFVDWFMDSIMLPFVCSIDDVDKSLKERNLIRGNIIKSSYVNALGNLALAFAVEQYLASNYSTASPEILNGLSKLFNEPDLAKDPIPSIRKTIKRYAQKLFDDAGKPELLDHIVIVGRRAYLQKKVFPTINAPLTEDNFNAAWRSLEDSCKEAYGLEHIKALNEEALYLGLRELFWPAASRRYEPEGKAGANLTLNKSDLEMYVARKLGLKNQFKDGGRIYISNDKKLVVLHYYYNADAAANLNSDLEQGNEGIIITRAENDQQSVRTLLNDALCARRDNETAQFIIRKSFISKIVPSSLAGFRGYDRNSYGVACYLEDRPLLRK